MKIEKLGEEVFKVTVSGSVATQHEVTVNDTAYQRLKSRSSPINRLGFACHDHINQKFGLVYPAHLLRLQGQAAKSAEI